MYEVVRTGARLKAVQLKPLFAKPRIFATFCAILWWHYHVAAAADIFYYVKHFILYIFCSVHNFILGFSVMEIYKNAAIKQYFSHTLNKIFFINRKQSICGWSFEQYFSHTLNKKMSWTESRTSVADLTKFKSGCVAFVKALYWATYTFPLCDKSTFSILDCCCFLYRKFLVITNV